MYIGENTEYNWIFDNMNFGGFRISSRVSIQTEVIIDRTHAGELWGGLIVDIRDNRSHMLHTLFPFERGVDLSGQREIDRAVSSLRRTIRRRMMEFGNNWIFN